MEDYLVDIRSIFDDFASSRFSEACKEGNLDKVNIIYNEFGSENSNLIYANFFEALRNATENGHLEIIKWLNNKEINHINLLDKACYVSMLVEQSIITASQKGFSDLIKWMKSVGTDIYRIRGSGYGDLSLTFLGSCAFGELELAQWIYEQSIIEQKEYLCTNTFDKVIQDACHDGHIELARWLHSIGADVHVGYEYSLRMACSNGHVEIVKWLCELGADIRVLDDDPFIKACGCNKFLRRVNLSVQKSQDWYFENYLYLTTMWETNGLAIAKYLYELGADIHAQSNKAYIEAVINDNKLIVDWLKSIYPNFKNIVGKSIHK